MHSKHSVLDMEVVLFFQRRNVLRQGMAWMGTPHDGAIVRQRENIGDPRIFWSLGWGSDWAFQWRNSWEPLHKHDKPLKGYEILYLVHTNTAGIPQFWTTHCMV